MEDYSVIIWGAGEKGQNVSKLLCRSEVKYFVDIDDQKVGRFINGLEIKNIDSIKNEKSDIQVIYTIRDNYVINYLNEWGGRFWYYEDYFMNDYVIQRMDNDLWDKYFLDKNYLRHTYRENVDNWFREDSCGKLNAQLIEAMKNGDNDIVNMIMKHSYSKNLVYYDELLENRPGMRLAYKIISGYGKKLTIADYACGHGELIKKLALEGYNTYALDASVARVETLKNSNVNAIVGDIQKIEFESDKFDVVICMECLEHVANVVIAKNEIWRTLKLGGIALISVPYMRNCDSELHVRQFDHSKLVSLFNHGFEVISLINISYLNWTYEDNIFLVVKKCDK